MIRIGIITEGSAEQKSLVELVKSLRSNETIIINPVFASIEPKATPQQIAKAAESRVKILNSKLCDRIILIIDMENTDQCLVKRVTVLEKAFHEKGYTNVNVVIKNRQYENWLIADIEAIGNCKGFTLTQVFKNKIVPNKADNVNNPVELLTKLKTNKRRFDKNADVLSIIKNCDPVRMGMHSRSFRRFLRLMNHPNYKTQSKFPRQDKE